MEGVATGQLWEGSSSLGPSLPLCFQLLDPTRERGESPGGEKAASEDVEEVTWGRRPGELFFSRKVSVAHLGKMRTDRGSQGQAWIVVRKKLRNS